MSGEDDIRDIHVINEELIAPPETVPESVLVVLVESDPNMESDSDEDLSEHWEEPEEDIGLPAGIHARLDGVTAAGLLGSGAVAETVKAEVIPAEAIPTEEGAEDSYIDPEI